MKTLNNQTLLLYKLCNQSSISCNQNNGRKWTNPLLILMVLMFLIPVQKVSAVQSMEIYYSLYPIKKPQYNVNSPLTTVDINFMYYSKIENYNCARNMKVSYLNPISQTYVKLFDYNYGESGNKFGFTNSTYTTTSGAFNNIGAINSILINDAAQTNFSATSGYIDNVYKVINPGFYSGTSAKWDFPPCLAGKTVTIKVEGLWQESFNTGDYPTGFTMYYELPIQSFNPVTTLSTTPASNGKKMLKWKNNTVGGVSKIVLYSDYTYKTKVDSAIVSATAASTKESDSIICVGAVENMAQGYTYYAKQFYNISGPLSGANFVTQSKELGQITHYGYKYPTTLKASYNAANQNVHLTWVAGNATLGQDVVYYVKRDGLVLNTKELTSCSYDAPILTADNWKSLTYTVYAVPKNWGNVQTFFQELSSSVTVSTTPNPPDFSNFKVTAYPTNGTKQPYMDVKWGVSMYPQNKVTLYHRASTSSVFTSIDIPLLQEGYIDNAVTDNSKHFYKMDVNVFGKTFTSRTDSQTVEKKVSFNSIQASKNTIGDRINLSWEIDRLDLCDRFEIYRSYSKDSAGIDVNSTPEKVQQLSAQTVYTSWDDLTAAPGVVYKYYVKASKTGLDGVLRSTQSSSDIGFRLPLGTVTGRVTYGGGTAVSGVSLYVNSSSLDDNLLYKSIQFKGSESQRGDVSLTKTQHGCVKDGFTFQTWMVSSRPALYSPIFEVNNEYSIGIRHDSVFAYIGTFDLKNPSLKYKLSSSLAENTYFHLSVSLDKNDSLKIFIDGQPQKTAFKKLLTHISTCSFLENDIINATTGLVTTARTKSYIGGKTTVNANVGAYNGYIDDVRLWNIALTNNVILGNYNRYLGGTEVGLIGYWPVDEGINSRAFDCSKTGQKFNEHHIAFTNVNTSTYVPDKTQLSIKGVTDKDGNYIIRGIPFSGTGSTYSIEPLLGTHKFEPTQLVRYISTSSLTHNSSDFTDKSSFPVKIKVRYSNTQYPVAGVMFFVDENPCSVENKLVKTASALSSDNPGEFKTIDAGECVIDVPIGEHYIRAELTGHTFENNGRWPQVGKEIFNEGSINTIEFKDTTLITVAGRVVGGAVQNSYPIGFMKSKANIGKAQIILQPTTLQSYKLNDSASDLIKPLSVSEESRFKSTTTFKANSNKVEIITDATTGEYMVKLPPIQWDIYSVKTSTNAAYTYDKAITEGIQSFNTNKLIYATDTVQNIVTNKIDSFTYNVKKSFVYQAPTVIEVRNSNAGEIAFGESEWNVVSPGLPDENRKLYDASKGKTPKSVKYIYGKDSIGGYPNGKPIFVQNQSYGLNIYAYEKYIHPEGKDTTIWKDFAKVPLKGAIVSVKNEIGLLQKSLVANPSDTIAAHVMKLDANGKKNYIFRAGFPNLSNVNAGLGLSISVKNGNASPIFWDEMGDFRGIVTGCEPIAGTNFVTSGPDKALVVLRDPPGSNSYAYWESGSTLSYSFIDKNTINTNASLTGTVRIGPEIKTVAGFGLMIMTEANTKGNLSIGYEGEYESFSGTTGTKTITTKERIQTSASPLFVGSNADVYIGVSTNMYFCQSKNLNIQKSGLKIDTVSTADISGSTEFRFSQNEIVTAQIPKWKQMIREILKKVTVIDAATKSYYQNLATTERKNYYLTTLESSNENFAKSGNYSIIRPNVTNLVLPDTIESIVNNINNWQNVISENEKTKKNAASNDTYVKNNISFDAGTLVERSYTYTDITGTTTGGSDKSQAVIGAETGFTLGGVGFSVKAETKIGSGNVTDNNNASEKQTTFGYVLSDPDADNRFAVNVFKNKMLDISENTDVNSFPSGYLDSSLGSYIFELVGGQTSCPSEVADSSLFYKVNDKLVLLANGTVPLDAPSMSFANYTKTDIPNGKDATFVLELSNNSIVQSPRPYMLSVDDASNKDGAIISVDGSPLTTGRIFYVTPKQPLTKTLTLHQTKLDVLDYQNIKLRFSSVCDASINKSQNISVTYVPSCSDLEIALDRQVINAENSAPLAVTLKNFNQEYKNFLGIQLEYKMEGETNWKKKVFAKDQTTKTALALKSITADMLIPNTGNSFISSFNYDLSLGEYDGNYTVRAKTLCDNGTQTPINNMTAEYTVVKDLVRPMAMGVPSPSNGILTPETEVSVTFNENILTGKLIPDNFEVKAVLNGATLTHAEGLALDGSDKSQAFTESSISLQNGSFAIEGWVRTAPDCLNYGNLFTIGTGADKVALNMKRTGMELRVNDVLIGSKTFNATSEWQYVSVTYDGNSQYISVNLLVGITSTNIVLQKLTAAISPVGRLLVGLGFIGNIHQVAVWSEYRNMSDLTDMNTTKTGTENNLIGYWPMDEASGKIAVDKARSRNMIVNSSWFIEPNGKSTTYNGVDQSTILKSTNIPFTSNDNFSVEFWFKSKSVKSTTMFSCGKGDTDAKPIEKLSIGFNDNKELCLNTKGNSYVVPNVSVQDTVWHHFALSVTRSGNTNVYIDGLQKLQLSSTKVGGMASDRISLGSRTYTDSTLVSGKYTYKNAENQFFNGSLDEVRIWGSALSSDNIRLDMHSRIKGSEIGLMAYYPFEEIVTGNTSTYSLKDFSVKNADIAVSTALANDNTPGIKIPRAKEAVSYSYTASDNKIIFSIDAAMTKTENCTLEFAVKEVTDLNNNVLKSPIKWTAFVNNNRLNWETESSSLTKQVLEPAAFKAIIVNNSGKYENFVIKGLPNWLSVDKSSGKLNPLEKMELTFTVDKATNVGSYETRVTLTGNNNIEELLPVSLKVTGTRPDWSVNPYAYESSMNVIGQVKIDGVYQEDAEDILAAFIGTRCVGLANPQFDKIKNSYVLFMDVYGNSTDNGQALSFSLWDAGTGRIYPAVEVIGSPISYIGTTIKGSMSVPQVFNATDKVEQQLSLKQGWNWMSTNVVNTNPTLLNQFKTGMEAACIQIKSRSGDYIEYSNGAWNGNNFEINQTSMYLVKTNQAKTLKMVGAMAKPADLALPINSNWNYIGYVPQFVAPIKDALSNLSATEGDQIKGQIGFATYSGGNWYGSLQYMMPGAGYMYNSMNSSPVSFKYPSQYFSQSKVAQQNEVAGNMRWTVDVNKYQMSMTATCIASVNNQEVTNGDMQVAVFVGDECRGTTTLKYVDTYSRYMAFLMIWGNIEDVNKKITFKSFNTINNQELSFSDQSLSYVPDNIVGTPASPYKINFVLAGNNEVNIDNLKLYPNPVSDVLHFDCNPNGIEALEVIDNLGRRLIGYTHVSKNSINVSSLLSGVYTLRIKYNGNVTNLMFVRK